jgi:hypothetical protein
MGVTCQSARKFGSDSVLMQFRIRVALPLGESPPCSKHFAAPVWSRPGLLWRVRFAIPTRLLSPSGHHKVLGFVRRAGLFRAGFIAVTGVGLGTFRCRKLVRQVVRGERNDVFRTRQSSLDVHLPWLDEEWASDCRNGAELWRRLTARGFRGSLRVVGEWATRRRRAEKADAENLQRIPSARTIARLMTIGVTRSQSLKPSPWRPSRPACPCSSRLARLSPNST